MKSFAIVNAVVETVTGKTIQNGAVLVKHGKIAAVSQKVAIDSSTEVIDAEGRLLTPGLIDAHSHAGLAEDGLVSDSDVNEKSGPVTPQVRALDAFKRTDVALLEAAQSGVTTIFITPGSANVFGGMGSVLKTVSPDASSQVILESAGLKMATGENPKRNYASKTMPATRMGVAALMRETFIKARVYEEKKLHNSKLKGDKRKPFETNLADEVVGGLLRGDYSARCHAHRAVDMLTTMRIAEEFGFELIFEHATECEQILPELVARKIPLIIGPSFGKRSKIELINKSFGSVSAAVKAGLLVAITADHSVTPLRYLNVYAAMAIREGLAPAEALKCITINAAKICGVAHRVGAIKRGFDADLVLWEGDVFDARTKPANVWIEGRSVDLEARYFTIPAPFKDI